MCTTNVMLGPSHDSAPKWLKQVGLRWEEMLLSRLRIFLGLEKILDHVDVSCSLVFVKKHHLTQM